jgi:hypothetical protein
MPDYAVVNSQGGEVSNIIVGADLASVQEIVGDAVEITEKTGPAGIGWNWDPETGKFSSL